MESNKPMAIELGLALVLSTGSIVTTNTVAKVFTPSELVSPFIRGTSTIIVLDPLQRSAAVDGGSGISNDVLHIGEKIVFTGNLMTREGYMLPNIPVKIFALTPTPEQKLVGKGVTGIDGSYFVTWVVEPYYIKPGSTETIKS